VPSSRAGRGRVTRFPAARFALLVLAVAATLAAGCDERASDQTPTAQATKGNGASEQSSPSPRARQESPAPSPRANEQTTQQGQVFRFAAGNVRLRRAGFDRLRILAFAAKRGWRGRIDDNNDDDVGVEFRKARREVDFRAELDGRLEVEVCEEVAQRGATFGVGEAGRVSLQRVGDEELRVSGTSTNASWRQRVTDNFDDEVHVVFTSRRDRLDFDAQFDDGRYEATICSRLSA
jgi:hypothetical protein